MYLVETALKQLAQRIVRTGLPRNSPSRNQLVHADFDIATAEPLSLRPSHLFQLSDDEARQVELVALRFLRAHLSHREIACLTLNSAQLAVALRQPMLRQQTEAAEIQSASIRVLT